MKKLIVSLGVMVPLFLVFAIFQSIVSSQTIPFTLRQILNAINAINTAKGNAKDLLSAKIIREVKQRRVDFQLTREKETLLRDEGATNEMIEVIRQSSPSMPGANPISVPTQIRTPTGSNNSKTFRNSLGIELVRIPNGSFQMGSEKGEPDEKPVHRVTISNAFYLGKTEVTQGQWKAVMGNNPSYFNTCGDNCPIENVSWEDVQNFINKLNNKGEGTYRLPTEAEWEYAARAGSTSDYSFGNDVSSMGDYAWYSSNSGDTTHQVATKKPNAWGLYDMHGNVWEWVQDWDGNYQSGNVTDPQVTAETGTNRVYRGGSWFSNTVYLRSAFRSGNIPSYRDNVLGFRLFRKE